SSACARAASAKKRSAASSKRSSRPHRAKEAAVDDRLIIETSELHKQYDGVDALRGLDLKVPAGSICGFLGRNGAGKTTTIKVLLGITHPTSGVARVFGSSPDAEVRR